MPVIYGKNGVILKGTTTLTEIENIRVTVEADTVIARSMGSNWPDEIVSGNRIVRGEIGKLYVDSETLFTDVSDGTPLTIEIRPEGTGTGKPKYTITGAIIESWGYEHPYNEFIRERVRFIGKSIAKATQ